jgi:Suppressor of fused protein (SUFU)
MASMTEHADIEAITAHIERQVGRVHTVLHEIASDELHIDIHYVKSSLFRRFEVLVTSGMSALPMAVPDESNEPRFAEIVTVLPKGWPISKQAFADERNYWPIRLMKTLARLPYLDRTWLGYGHTTANGPIGDDIRPYAEGTELCAAVLLPSTSLGEDFWCMSRSHAPDIFFWAAIPLHRTELEFKLEHGIDALLELFDKNGVTDRIDPLRPRVV